MTRLEEHGEGCGDATTGNRDGEIPRRDNHHYPFALCIDSGQLSEGARACGVVVHKVDGFGNFRVGFSEQFAAIG